MADKLLTLDMKTSEADGAGVMGKFVNIYDDYANALANGSAGLSTVKELTVLTGAVGSVVTQTAKVEGPIIDNNGMLNVFLDDGGGSQDYYIIGDLGRGRHPRKVVVQA